LLAGFLGAHVTPGSASRTFRGASGGHTQDAPTAQPLTESPRHRTWLEPFDCNAEAGTVTHHSGKAAGPTAGAQDTDALDFIDLLLAHIPDKGQVLQRYCGHYSNTAGAYTTRRSIACSRSQDSSNAFRSAQPGSTSPSSLQNRSV